MVRPQQIADCRCGAKPGNCLRTCRSHARRCWRRSVYAIYLVAAYARRTWATGTFYLMSACFQAGKSRADQRLARCGSTSTATISDTPLLEYQRAALAYRHRVAQHDALALIARVGIGAIFFLSGRTRVESWLISVCCRWRTGPRQRQRAAWNSLLRYARPPWR